MTSSSHRPSGIDLSNVISRLTQKKMALVDPRLADSFIELTEGKMIRDAEKMSSILHVTFDAALEKALRKENYKASSLRFEIILKIDETSITINQNDNIAFRVLSGYRKKALARRIRSLLRPLLEEQLKTIRFNGKQNYIKLLIRRIALAFSNILSDNRLYCHDRTKVEVIIV